MKPQQNVDLSKYSSMRLGGRADYLVTVHSKTELTQAIVWAQSHGLPMIMIGGGTNIYWKDDGFRGLVIVNKIAGYDDQPQTDGSHLLTIGSGEIWDQVVARSVEAGLTGIEALSLIPGTAGGTPVQNVGAYGQRISNVLVSLEAFDIQTGDFTVIQEADCAFGYRESRFKTTDRGRFFITSIVLRLVQGNPEPPYYAAIDDYLQKHPMDGPMTPAKLRTTVIAIRNLKLPDPTKIANNGSFFANPIVDAETAKKLQKVFPDMPCWPGDGDTCKIPAAWLIESVGLKGFHDPETGMATWHNHALVLVNEHAKTTDDLLRFKQRIVNTVEQKFGITLVQEPELLPH